MGVRIGCVELDTAQPAEVGVTPPAGHLVTTIQLLYRSITVRTVLNTEHI